MTAVRQLRSNLLCENVGFSADGRDLLRAVNVTIAPGAPTLVIGPNGAGKSLFLRLCHGLIRPTSGRIFWEPREEAQAMVLQGPVMLRRSARANLVHALALKGVPRSLRTDQADAALERFALQDAARQQARTLSGGEQQRLAIARAWATEPRLLLLDEPTSALDPGATGAIEEMIETISAEGTKIVMTTHDLGQARRLAGEVLFFHKGAILEQTPAADFFAEPRTDLATRYLRGDLLW